ncbi:hypothetical protein [Clostridium folliculivorans]|uniref:Uncharacterized protein n=1 Tax=Clostridium folliculivorans TaxID=2886038 RepID=A0A9W6D9J2_9CLOT|nr:hypothetical protein [Clostridium folliculivorans]GKU23748.1 hypothetical protein CFOLD11_05740 [Clostridium folliculivorans]GKU29864.1 hypothetical protein CFB3_19710 [Clostridium folliculivorans]
MDNFNKKIKKSSNNDDSKTNIEVWEDLVSIKELALSLIICSVTAFGAYFIAPKERPKQLLLGLIGAIVGFVICSIIIKPKRTFIEATQED